jgi:hypothetical protein
MAHIATRLRVIVLALGLLLTPLAHAGYDSDRYDHGRRDHDSYMFAATRSLNHSDTPTLLKATLLPLTLVADIVFLPIAALADAVS